MQRLRPEKAVKVTTDRAGYFPILVQLGDGTLKKVDSPEGLPKGKPFVVKETRYLVGRKQLQVHQ